MGFIYFLYGYLILGVCSYLYLILGKKLAKLDEDTEGTSFTFKVLIFPGMLLMWPFILAKLFKS